MIKANFCLNCMTFGCYEEEIDIYEFSAFKGREKIDRIEGESYCLACEDGGSIIFAEVDEDVLEVLKKLYGSMPLENNPASAAVLLLAIADHFETFKRATVRPSRIIPEGFDKKLAEEAITEKSHEAIIEAWMAVIREKVSKNVKISETLQRAAEDLLKLYPDDEKILRVCKKIKSVVVP